MRVAADPNRTRLIVEKAGRRKEMLEMLKKILSTSSARIPFTSSTGEELRIPKMILNRSDADWSCFFMGPKITNVFRNPTQVKLQIFL